MKRLRRAALRGVAVLALVVGVVAARPDAAFADSPTAPNPNFNGWCDATTQTCTLMEPQGSSDTVWGTVTYSISGDTITFEITPEPSTAPVTEAQYCDSAEPYTNITANLCAGSDRQHGSGGPASQLIDLSYDGVSYVGSAIYNPDEPYWVIHVVVDGNTVYAVGTEAAEETPQSCPDGSAMPETDQNDDGVIDEADCASDDEPVTCPDGSAMPDADQNGDGVIDEADCASDDEPATCPDGSAMPDADQNGDGVIDEADCASDDEPVTCPDGSAMPDADQNGDGVIDAADCDVAPANNPPQETPRVAPVATTETAAETPPAVLAADDTRPTAVLGETLAQPEVAGATLARTGPSQLGALGMSGGLLVAAGLVATVWGRRRVVV